MVKGDVIVFGRKVRFAALGRALVYLVHAVDVHLQGVHSSQILQGKIHGLIDAGDHQQEQEEGHQGQLAAQQAHTAYQRHRDDAQLENHLRRDNKHSRSQLAFNVPYLQRVDLLIQTVEVFLFCLAAFQIADGFQTLLHTLCHSKACGGLPAGKIVLRFFRETYNHQRHRQHPQSRKCHLPVIEQQTDGHKTSRNDRPIKLGNIVGEHLLRHLHISHDGVGQVGQIFLAEKGKRKLPQLFRQPDTAGPGFPVSRKVSGVVLPELGEPNQGQRRHDSDGIKLIVGLFTVQKIADQQIEQPHR